MGLYIDESLEEQVKFTVLATGFGIKDVPGMDNMMNKRTIEEQKKLEELEEEEQRKDERRGDYYGKDTFKNSNKKKRHNIYIFSLEDLDNDDIISMVETTLLSNVPNCVGKYPVQSNSRRRGNVQ